MLRYPFNRRVKSKPRKQQDQPLTLESLESRQMMSAGGLLVSTLATQAAVSNLNLSVIAQPLSAPSASSVNPDTGNTITSTGNPDGSQTVTETTPNGQTVSTTNFPASRPPSGSSTDPRTGNTTTTTGNPDGTRTVTVTNPDGEVISTTTKGTPKPKAPQDQEQDQDQPQVPEIYMLVYDINTGNDYPIFEGDLDSNAGGLLGGSGTQSGTTGNTAPSTPSQPTGSPEDSQDPSDQSSNTTPDTPQDSAPPTSPGQTDNTDSQEQSNNTQTGNSSQNNDSSALDFIKATSGG